jgi:tRNA(fMet)-specific endonuclease VapC
MTDIGMYLFDTDTITNILKPAPSSRLQGKLTEVPAERQFISTITIYEIVYGAYKSDRTDHHLRNLRELLLPQVAIVDFDSEAAYVCGALRVELERSGAPLPLADLQVASIAIANELVLVTGNVGHFQRIPGLPVENWM